MLEQKKAVIFDLDGTLVDSMWMWKSIDIEFLGSRGLACPEDLQKEICKASFYPVYPIIGSTFCFRKYTNTNISTGISPDILRSSMD